MAKVSLDSLGDVLDSKDVAAVLGVSYVKALRLIRYSGMAYLRLGRTYKVSKQNFIEWLNCKKPTVIDLDLY